MKANELPIYHRGLLNCCLHSILNSTADVEVGSTIPCTHKHDGQEYLIEVIIEGKEEPSWKAPNLKGKCTYCHGDGFDHGLHGLTICYPCRGTGKAFREVEDFPPKRFASFKDAKLFLDL